MRALLGKGTVFRWLPEHSEEFDKLKRLLSEQLLTRHFNPDLPVQLLTDASRHHGLGYALCQPAPDGSLSLITCGSKSLTPTQQRYATIELECLAIMWAIHKCAFYLKGLRGFTVLTDHRPLEGVFKKDLFDLPNARLQRMREKCSGYVFDVKWVAGKNHRIADALSRAPLFAPEEEPDIKIDSALTCLAITDDPAYNILDHHIDSDYIQCCNDIAGGTQRSTLIKQLANVKDNLSLQGKLILLDSTRIVPPRDCH